MKNEIFSDLIKKQEKTKKWLFVPLSFMLHMLAIVAIVVSPLLNADAMLPPVKTVEVVVVVPNDLSMPVGRSGGGRKPAKTSKVKSEKPVAVAVNNTLTAPIEIPDEIPEEKITDFGMGDGTGGEYIDGAIEGGPDSVPGASIFKPQTAETSRVIRVEQTPRVLRKVSPVYPPIALRARIQGMVIVEAVTDIYGKVIKTRVIRGNPLLTEAALEAVKKWVYEPYVINGLAKPVRFIVELNFEIQ